MKKYEMASVVFGVKFNFPFTEFFLKDYLYSGDKPCRFVIEITKSDLDRERELTPEFVDDELENVAVLRALCDKLLDENVIMFHSSAIKVDNEAYLFTAPSGTGKSTHTALYKKYFGDRAEYINDDKPFIKIDEKNITVYGNAWTGKHMLGNNTQASIKGICKIAQGKVNRIRRMDSGEMLLTLLDQTERPDNVEAFDKLLTLLGKLVERIPSYYLECDISREAVEVSYNAMVKGE